MLKVAEATGWDARRIAESSALALGNVVLMMWKKGPRAALF